MNDGHKVGCTGKRQFARFGQAARAAKRRRRMDGGAHVEAYHCRHCRHCNAFHIGENRNYRKPNWRTEVEPA